MQLVAKRFRMYYATWNTPLKSKERILTLIQTRGPSREEQSRGANQKAVYSLMCTCDKEKTVK